MNTTHTTPESIQNQTSTSTPTTVKIRIDDTDVFILGTAHISKQSVIDVKKAVELYNVDCIAVELDRARYEKITNKNNAFEKLDIFSIIKQKKAMFLLSSIMLSSFQRRLGSQLDIKPGAEMLAAINESKIRNIACALIDRPADITLKRAWTMSSFWGKQKIFAALIGMFFTKEKISEEQLQDLKQSSLQGQMLQELSDFLPDLKKVLLDERDEYLASKILQSKKSHKSTKMLAVLGAAHVQGVCTYLNKYIAAKKNQNSDITNLSARLTALEHIPKSRGIMTFLKYLIPLGIITLLISGFINGGSRVGSQNIIEWYLINGFLSLFGALISWANPVTMLVAFVAAPFTSINPFLGVGFLTGLTEAWMRKPRVQDITELQDIQLSIKNVYKNRITRILLVFLFTTLGSAVGTFIAIPALFN